jgi:hypothetical protein
MVPVAGIHFVATSHKIRVEESSFLWLHTIPTYDVNLQQQKWVDVPESYHWRRRFCCNSSSSTLYFFFRINKA